MRTALEQGPWSLTLSVHVEGKFRIVNVEDGFVWMDGISLIHARRLVGILNSSEVGQ